MALIQISVENEVCGGQMKVKTSNKLFSVLNTVISRLKKHAL